jgi:hypothetical protein
VRFVPPEAPNDPMRLVASIERPGLAASASYVLEVRGRVLKVQSGEEAKPALWMVTTQRCVEHFLHDFTGAKRFVPKRAAPRPGSVLLPTDPRLLKRLVMVNGRIEMATEIDGERLWIVLGAGDAAKRGVDTDDPDVSVEAEVRALDRVIAGKLGPEEALADGDVRVKGKRLVAMQFALAVAPFYPAK